MVGSEESPCSVSALTECIRRTLEPGFQKVFLEGEISGWRPATSGHVYFTLKDSGSQIPVVMFKTSYDACLRRHPGIESELKDGAKVLLYGKVTVYPQRGAYQFVALAARLVGAGELMQRFLLLKAKLEREGLFAPDRKRPLPALPRRIGVVTSASGAVIHDICRVLTARFPALEVRLFPAVVQGPGAPPTLIAGLDYFDACADWRADLVILARGGGSFEDLFCFNDEALVRRVSASTIPVISAVGHQTDFTLCDFAADARAGTPSIAAEMAVPVLADVIARLRGLQDRAVARLRSGYEANAQRVDGLDERLLPALRSRAGDAVQRVATLAGRLAPALKLRAADFAAGIDRLAAALNASLDLRLVRTESRLAEAERSLRLLSPYGVLERGYSLTTGADGRILRDADDVVPGERIETRLAKGVVKSTVVR